MEFLPLQFVGWNFADCGPVECGRHGARGESGTESRDAAFARRPRDEEGGRTRPAIVYAVRNISLQRRIYVKRAFPKVQIQFESTLEFLITIEADGPCPEALGAGLVHGIVIVVDDLNDHAQPSR
jgi:hypothetical protein